ncbi:hypothetical protein Cgig2_022787 [Carnegiea gigantea]|uniref:Protein DETOXIFICATION n=1 Tax=Carnegiea gigantea TaxID=171969 RepID=A0A9Q1KDL7_9CARY|nr:hypothetical protein Cgig2_022787 [Carnegiea gigantea]
MEKQSSSEERPQYHESLLMKARRAGGDCDEEGASDLRTQTKTCGNFCGCLEGFLGRINDKSEVLEEAKMQIWLAGPLIAVSLLQFSIQVISIMFTGHLGELPLSSASIASTFASVTGATVLGGMGSALETLCGQSYGANQYKMLGVHTQRAIISLLAMSIPLSIIWFYTGEILILCGQDHEISMGAGTFNRWMIPTLFAYGILQCLNRFLQTQNLVFPMMISSLITSLLHALVCWVLVFVLGFGIKGAAMANNVSYCLNVLFLAIYVKISPTCKTTWVDFSSEALDDIWSFLRLAIPSACMMCFNTCWIVYMISFRLSGGISTRISNELGAGQPDRAKLALYVMVTMSISEGLVVAVITILVCHVWGRLYSDEDEVVNYVAKLMLLLAISDFLDGFQCVLSGAARGCGWQKNCAFINLGAFYLIALPCAVMFAFLLHLGGMGLWTGIICGLCVQVVAIVTINSCTNWEKEAEKALERIES